MKKLLIICAIITLILIGCKKEDLSPPVDPHHQYYLDSLVQDSLTYNKCGIVTYKWIQPKTQTENYYYIKVINIWTKDYMEMIVASDNPVYGSSDDWGQITIWG